MASPLQRGGPLGPGSLDDSRRTIGESPNPRRAIGRRPARPVRNRSEAPDNQSTLAGEIPAHLTVRSNSRGVQMIEAIQRDLDEPIEGKATESRPEASQSGDEVVSGV